MIDVGYEPKNKNKKSLNLNWRNTIPWRIECERQGFSREQGLEQFNITMSQNVEAKDSIVDSVFPTLALMGFL